VAAELIVNLEEENVYLVELATEGGMFGAIIGKVLFMPFLAK
jgi:hypothetical protein